MTLPRGCSLVSTEAYAKSPNEIGCTKLKLWAEEWKGSVTNALAKERAAVLAQFSKENGRYPDGTRSSVSHVAKSEFANRREDSASYRRSNHVDRGIM